jgi:hypothetical protein
MAVEAKRAFTTRNAFTEQETAENKFCCVSCKLWFPGKGIDADGYNFETKLHPTVEDSAVYCSNECYVTYWPT